MSTDKIAQNAPNQQEVLDCLQREDFLGEWVRPHEGAQATDLDADQFRAAANRLHAKGYLEKDKKGTKVPYYPGVGVLDEGKRVELLRENDISEDKWKETWRRWKKQPKKRATG